MRGGRDGEGRERRKDVRNTRKQARKKGEGAIEERKEGGRRKGKKEGREGRKEEKITSAGKDVKNLKPLCTISRNVQWYNSLLRVAAPQKTKTRVTI